MSGEVGALRAEIAKLPDAAGVILEDEHGYKYVLERAFAIGMSTDDPGLVVKIRPYYPDYPDSR